MSNRVKVKRSSAPIVPLRLAVGLALAVAVFVLIGTGVAGAKPLKKAKWLGGVEVTEYYPTPESWFVCKKVAVPGLTGKHRIDWLYSATGVSMEGEGIGLDGQLYHIDELGDGGWITSNGRSSIASKNWRGGPPFWRSGAYWLTKTHAVTFPLDGGGWSNGVGKRYVPLRDVTFAAGPSKPLTYWKSLAVDPRLIPLGSRIYIAAYADSPGHGWFTAGDVGGAIVGRHVDVYRAPPSSPDDGGQLLDGQRIYVIPPGAKAGAGAPTGSGKVPTAGGAGTTPPPPGAPSGGASAP